MGPGLKVRGVLPFLVALQACATLAPPEQSDRVPFERPFHGLQVASGISEGAIELALACGPGEPREVRVYVPPTTIGRREVIRRQIVSYREEAICDGDTCRLVKVPVFREETASEPVYADIEVSCSSVSLEQGQLGTIRLRLLNAAEATFPFVLVVRLLVGDATRGGGLEILCDSELLMAKSPRDAGPPPPGGAGDRPPSP